MKRAPTGRPTPAAIALAGVVLFTFQYLVGALLVSQQRADELELRAKQLAGFQVALLGALLRTLDLRDRMTARHSAAVARYSREIAALARIIAVADTYDVLTARDSYRRPVSSFEAITELRRVAGTQLEPMFVEILADVLADKGFSYRHVEGRIWYAPPAPELELTALKFPPDSHITIACGIAQSPNQLDTVSCACA